MILSRFAGNASNAQFLGLLVVILACVCPTRGVTAALVCSTGSDGTVVISSNATRVNVYYAAPDPAVSTITVPNGSSSYGPRSGAASPEQSLGPG